MFVAIVILNYNGRAFLQRFLPSVYATEYTDCAIYLADNASTDDSRDFLISEGFIPLPEGKNPQKGGRFLIELSENYGFAEGYNRALKQIQGADAFLLLNSDVEVVPNWLSPLVERLQSSPHIAAVQPKILAYERREHFEHAGAAGGWLDKWGYPFCRGRIFEDCERDEGQYDEAQAVFWASGAAMLVRADLFLAFGGFDGSFFAHMEEIDLCWRLKRAGFSVYCEPQSRVYHVGGGTLHKSNPRKTFLNFRNNLLMIAKNVDALWLGYLILLRLLLDGLAGLRFAAKGEWGNLWAVVRAHWAFFFRLPRTLFAARRLPAAAPRIAPKLNEAGILRRSIVIGAFWHKFKTFRQFFG